MKPRWVRLDGRAFVVHFDEQGAPLRITERKLWCPGTIFEQYINAPYWHRKHHTGNFKPTSIVSRIVEEVAK